MAPHARSLNLNLTRGPGSIQRRLGDVALIRPRYKRRVHGMLRRVRWRFWIIRAGPRGGSCCSSAVPAGRLEAPDPCALPELALLRVVHRRPGLPPRARRCGRPYPTAPVEPDAAIISPRRVRAFVRMIAPGARPEPRLDALVALEEEHGLRPLSGDPVRDAAGASTCGPFLSLVATGQLSLRTRSIHRPSFEDAHRFHFRLSSDPEPLFLDPDPLYDTDPLFDVVDVLLPLYLAATAISSGAYDRLLQRRGKNKHRRYGWRLEIEERIAFPAPAVVLTRSGSPDGSRP